MTSAGPITETTLLAATDAGMLADAEPGAKDAQGKPAAGALPDFVVLISPENTTDRPYRTHLRTFESG